MKTLEQLKDMRKELTRHDYQYYILFQPSILDQVYDHMVKDYDQEIYNWQEHTPLDEERDVGKNTRSLELEDEYPQWVRDEFQGVEPRL